jgi:hypothetical protein
MKKIWITSLPKDEKQIGPIMGLAKQYGLEVQGHFWVDDLKKMAWLAPKDNLVDPETSLWVIVGSQKDIGADTVCTGVALLALAVQAKKGNGFPILWVNTEGEIDLEKLPTPLRGIEIIDASSPSLGAKLVARANTPPQKITLEYRLDLHANPGLGLWVEIGPAKGLEWTGALLGVQDGEIGSQGVGNAGKLPEKAVLEYPVKGLKLQLQDKEYTAWAVQNKLDEQSSYFVRVDGTPKSILFGAYSQDEEADFYIIDLC